MTIISFHYKYIFIANPKTGSTSIHQILSEKYTKPGDIVAKKSVHQKPIGKHDSLQAVRDYLETKGMKLEDFFVFSFVREPFARIISCFNYEIQQGMYRIKNNQPMKDFLQNYLTKPSNIVHMRKANSFFYINGEIPSFCHIFKIENLNLFCEMLRDKTNISIEPSQVPQANKSVKVINPDMNKLLSSIPRETIEILYNVYTNDFNLYYNVEEKFSITKK